MTLPNLKIVEVVAGLIFDQDRLLVCQRSSRGSFALKWEFPGGKCEEDESLEAAARRELGEELGVEVVEVGEAEFVVQDIGSPYLIAFTPVQIIGEPICKEHLQLIWGTPSEISRLSLAPCDKQYLETRLAHG